MIALDYTFSLIDESELDEVIRKVEEINERVKRKPYPFMELPYIRFQLKEMEEMVRNLKKKRLEDVILLGIGGSALGAKAICEALLSYSRDKKPRLWILDNIDPFTINWVLEKIEKKKSLLVVVSKSGETTETLAQFMIFKDALREVSDLKEKVVIITDPQNGTLKRIAEKEGYLCLFVPRDVGGRFSVLTPVAMFPSLLMGVKIEEIFDGAKKMAEHIRTFSRRENMSFVIAAILYLMDKKGKSLHVIMPYCDRLIGFSEWFRQLEAESLGKGGKGPTPIHSRGVTDQHSQLQLYIDGPKNKFLIFMYSFSEGPSVPDSFSYLDELSYLSGKTLEDLFLAELTATKLSLLEASVPSIDIRIDEISAFSMGALFYLFEMVIAFFGELLGVNPFDQPAVEKGKVYTKALLGAKGYENVKSQIEILQSGKRAIVSL